MSFQKSNQFIKYVQLVLVATLLVGLSACGNDDDPSGSANAGAMTATINGERWEAVEVQGTYENGVLGIGGTDLEAGDTQQINISGLVNGEGNYSIALFGGLIATYTIATSPTDVNPQNGTSGQLIIESLTENSVKGTFNFSGNGFSITDGSFELNF